MDEYGYRALEMIANRERLKKWEKNLCQYHFVHHKSLTAALGSNLGLPV
jgi:hypothetical protein